LIKISKYAPITMFVYNRPWHTSQTVEALQRNELASESELFIYSDGPKSEADKKAVKEVREYVKSIEGFEQINVIESENNMGLLKSVVTGVTEIINKYGRIIVLEDDLLTSAYFLDYMNKALNQYERNEKVMQISGHMFPVELNTDADAVFLPFTTSWGWATWQRAWDHFDAEMKGYEKLKSDKALRKKFDLDGAYPYFTMLENQRRGRVDSWAISWYLSVFMHNGLTLFPHKTLVQNIGFDGSGTHKAAKSEDSFTSIINMRTVTFPLEDDISKRSFAHVKEYLKGRRSGIRIMNILKRLVTKYL
jgi:hypothetical protein